MTFSPGVRKLVLITDVVSSVGWLGAVAAYLVLDVTAVLTESAEVARAAYIGMALTIWYAIVPLALASLIIGLANSLGTPWGLFRHYWVVVKLLLTIFATLVLLKEAQTVSLLAEASASVDPRTLPGTLPHSVGGLLVLLVITILAIVKPRGLTRYGWRRQHTD